MRPKGVSQYENQPLSASMSDKLYTCQKYPRSIPEGCIPEGCLTLPACKPVADAIIIDGSALVNSLRPRASKTCVEYAALDVIPSIQVSTNYQRTDIVFYVHQLTNLKSETSKEGDQQWKNFSETNFLRENDNKTEFFIFLANMTTEMYIANVVIATTVQDVASNRTISLEGVAPCSREEANTRASWAKHLTWIWW